MQLKAAVAASASLLAMSGVHAEKLSKADVFVNVVQCKNVFKEGEPYVYMAIDESSLSAAEVRQTGIGQKISGNDKENLYRFPEALQIWEKANSPSLEKLEIYLYGSDSLRPDTRLGKYFYPMDQVANNCAAKNFTVTLNGEHNTDCSFQIAICPVGSKPKELRPQPSVTSSATPTQDNPPPELAPPKEESN